MLRRANAAKLTKPQRAMLEKIAQPGKHYPSHFNERVYRNLRFANPALVETRRDDNNFHQVHITEAGLIAIGRAVAPAQPVGDFGVGDRVVIRKDAIFDSSPLDNYRDKRAVATVTEVYDGQEFDYEIAFGDGDAVDTWLMLANELELWKPAEPGSNADSELESRRRIMQEINDLMYAAKGNPGTRAFNQTSMVDDVKALIQERAMQTRQLTALRQGLQGINAVLNDTQLDKTAYIAATRIRDIIVDAQAAGRAYEALAEVVE